MCTSLRPPLAASVLVGGFTSNLAYILSLQHGRRLLSPAIAWYVAIAAGYLLAGTAVMLAAWITRRAWLRREDPTDPGWICGVLLATIALGFGVLPWLSVHAILDNWNDFGKW